ncbi:MAG TPA: isochorismate synthase [Chlamydiales bacterium]|nr:isochorismate synthase [Chlamydiales bacterium]
MKIYWADREGKPAPDACAFHWRPFAAHLTTTSPIEQALLPAPISVKVVKRTYLPTKEKWMANVERALDLIRQKALQKVVLARTCILELSSAPDPFAIAAALKEKAQGAFLFCLQTDAGAFLGATPERLFARKGRQVISEAVAGTRRRGRTLFEDAKLQKELLFSSKDLRELSPVCDHLQNALAPLCTTPLAFTPIAVHQTQNVQHLYSRCSGKLRPAISDEEILTRLHPTPALCGTPRQKAFSTIQELEPFERGLYGGTIGWTTPEASEWIVAIRSCLLTGKSATLFSGTGIVEGSDPEKEWDELNQKLKLYDGILDY